MLMWVWALAMDLTSNPTATCRNIYALLDNGNEGRVENSHVKSGEFKHKKQYEMGRQCFREIGREKSGKCSRTSRYEREKRRSGISDEIGLSDLM